MGNNYTFGPQADTQVQAVNKGAAIDANRARALGLSDAAVAKIASTPIPSVRNAILQTLMSTPASADDGESGDIGGDQNPLVPATRPTTNCNTAGTGGAGKLPGIVWADIAAITAYDGPYFYYEDKLPWYYVTQSALPSEIRFQGRVRAAGTASPLDLAAAQTAATRSVALGFRLEVTVPGDSAPSAGTFVFSYIDTSQVARTLNLSAIPIAGRLGLVRILPGLTSLFGKPARHAAVVNNALVVTTTALVAPVTATSVAFSSLPANTVVAAELIQPGAPTYLEDIEAFARAK